MLRPTILRCLLSGAALASLLVGQANAASVGSSLTAPLPHQLFEFATTGPGPVDPGVLVGFNPQPDPPGDHASLDVTNAEAPSIDSPGFSAYTILFGIHGPGGDPFSFQVPAGGPNSDGVFSFYALGDGSVFRVGFDISGFAGGWEGFNPQPDPPGDFGDSFVGFTFAGDAALRWTMQEGTLDGDTFTPTGGLESFALVPEPATLALLGLGITGIAFAHRRRR